MSAHLYIIYPHPKNPKEFDRAYREEHLPFAGPKLEGATSVVTKRVVGPSFSPPPYHLMSDVSFPTIEPTSRRVDSSRLWTSASTTGKSSTTRRATSTS